MESSEKIKKEYRDNAKKLLVENETLQNKLVHAEKDTVQVISFLKAEDVKKEKQVCNSWSTNFFEVYSVQLLQFFAKGARSVLVYIESGSLLRTN